MGTKEKKWTWRVDISHFICDSSLSTNFNDRSINPISQSFVKKCIFWTFWTFSAWMWAKLAPIYPKRHLKHGETWQHASLYTSIKALDEKVTYILWLFVFCFFALLFFLFLSFCCSGWPSNGLASSSRILEKASWRRTILGVAKYSSG